jgi:uncharacterized repeat protein (TIGR01451 family)
MKSTSAVVPKHLLRGALALFALAVAFAAAEASASTAANTVITNTARVEYDDAGGVPQTPVTASASVTILLVAAAPDLTSPADQAIAQGTSATLSYTVTSNANGPDTYDITSAAVENNVSHVDPGVPADLTLGGTTVAAAASTGAAAIVVPLDGVADAYAHNGLAVGDLVVVNGREYTIASITDDPVANTTTFGIVGTLQADIAAGDIVGERAVFTVSVASGTIVSGGSGTHTVTTTATSNTDAGASTPQATPTVVTVNRPTLTVAKTVSVEGGAFAATGTAAPGALLTYQVVASNTGATPASAVAFTDVLPAYLTYEPGTARWGTAADSYGTATPVDDDTAGSPDDGYSYTAATRTISFDPGGATGTVAGGGALVLYYQARVNP